MTFVFGPEEKKRIAKEFTNYLVDCSFSFVVLVEEVLQGCLQEHGRKRRTYVVYRLGNVYRAWPKQWLPTQRPKELSRQCISSSTLYNFLKLDSRLLPLVREPKIPCQKI
jgi:hypothetical protein